MLQSPCQVRDAEAGRWCPDLGLALQGRGGVLPPCCVPSLGIISWARAGEGQLVWPEWYHRYLLYSSEALLTLPLLLGTTFSV